MRVFDYMHAKLVSRTSGRWHAIGPVIYVQPASWWMLHFYARWFRLPEQRGWHWGLTVWMGEHGPRLHRGGRP